MITCAEIVYSLTQTEVCLCDFADCESPRLHTGVWRRLLSPLPFCVTDRQDQLHQPRGKTRLSFRLTFLQPLLSLCLSLCLRLPDLPQRCSGDICVALLMSTLC